MLSAVLVLVTKHQSRMWITHKNHISIAVVWRFIAPVERSHGYAVEVVTLPSVSHVHHIHSSQMKSVQYRLSMADNADRTEIVQKVGILSDF